MLAQSQVRLSDGRCLKVFAVPVLYGEGDGEAVAGVDLLTEKICIYYEVLKETDVI